MSKLGNSILSFGMSGYLVSDDLKRIEKQFNIELGHLPPAVSITPIDYYPQFEQSIRGEAAEMSRHYELFYCLEISVRKLIIEALRENAGSNWWENGKIPDNIKNDVKKRIQNEVDNGVTRRSEESIDYTTFGELSMIITTNWDLFGTIFSSKRAVEKVMSSLNLLRGPIAHCCPLSEDEVDRLNLTVKDWFRIIG